MRVYLEDTIVTIVWSEGINSISVFSEWKKKEGFGW